MRLSAAILRTLILSYFHLSLKVIIFSELLSTKQTCKLWCCLLMTWTHYDTVTMHWGHKGIKHEGIDRFSQYKLRICVQTLCEDGSGLRVAVVYPPVAGGLGPGHLLALLPAAPPRQAQGPAPRSQGSPLQANSPRGHAGADSSIDFTITEKAPISHLLTVGATPI